MPHKRFARAAGMRPQAGIQNGGLWSADFLGEPPM